MNTVITDDDIQTLRHSLGIEWAHDKPYRNYYCKELPSPQMERLVRAGLMKPGRFVPGWDKEDPPRRLRYFHVTECGELLAWDDIPKKTRGQLRYLKYLDISDVYPDLTFKEFLTHPDFKNARS